MGKKIPKDDGGRVIVREIFKYNPKIPTLSIARCPDIPTQSHCLDIRVILALVIVDSLYLFSRNKKSPDMSNGILMVWRAWTWMIQLISKRYWMHYHGIVNVSGDVNQ